MDRSLEAKRDCINCPTANSLVVNLGRGGGQGRIPEARSPSLHYIPNLPLLSVTNGRIMVWDAGVIILILKMMHLKLEAKWPSPGHILREVGEPQLKSGCSSSFHHR